MTTAAMNGAGFIQFRTLTKEFQAPDGSAIRVVDPIALTIREGEFVVFVGPSGCGKTTVMRMVGGLEVPTSGEIYLAGKLVTGPSRDKGMVFQSYSSFPWLTVFGNIRFGMKYRRDLTPAEKDRIARRYLDLVGLAPFADYTINRISGGMRQRVAIARTLAADPLVLLMDEPFGALDAQTRCQMQSYLLQIWRNVDVTIVFITHDLDEAIYLADRILVLKPHPGRVDELIEVPVPRPRTPEQFISPEFLATKKRLEELIHPPGDSAGDKLPTLRLTRVDDEVE